MNISKKTILITGSGSGIGKDAAFALAKRGHTVIATTETEHQAQALQKEAESQNLDIQTYKLDVTKEEDRQKVLQHDTIDVLINNAGIGESGSLAEIPLDILRNNFEVNVFGPISLTQLVLQNMIKQNNGTIIFISSTAGRITLPFLGSYNMTKFSLSAGGESLRKELHTISNSIHMTVVEPGAYSTGFNQQMIANRARWLNEDSYFHKINKVLEKRQLAFFNLIESKNTASIVKKIVKASEANKPRLRYVAPLWQAVGVQILRIFGK